MKSRIYGYLSLIAILISFGSCTKEMSKEVGSIKQVLNGDFYATIDGNQWNADSLQLVLVSNNGVAISGLAKDGEQVTMILPTFQTGTYAINSVSSSTAIFSNLLVNTTAIFTSSTALSNGAVNITNIDTAKHLVSGTFSYTLVDPTDNSQKSITSGVFNAVPYTGTTGGTGGGLKDTLDAVVGGVPFDGALVVSNITNGQLFVAGISADGNEDVALSMPQNVTPGVYNMDFASGMYFGVYNIGTSIQLLSQMNGTLTIISNDTVNRRMSGTFSFIASPLLSGTPVTITGGYFSFSY
jgi:Family of unknown function (DUF6252)